VALLTVGCFAATGLWEGGKTYAPKPRQVDLGPMAALARHADYGADRAFALDEIEPELDALGPDEKLIVFRTDNDERGAMGSDVVTYLAWPRRVDHFIEIPGGTRPKLSDIHQSYGVLILCGSHVPLGYPKVPRDGSRPSFGAAGVLRVGPHLEMLLFENSARHP
jgi:hypothetical protein